jgi:hypothetical protein
MDKAFLGANLWVAAEFPSEDTHLCNAYLYGLFVRSNLTWTAMVTQRLDL